jgi:hypothetical protein
MDAKERHDMLRILNLVSTALADCQNAIAEIHAKIQSIEPQQLKVSSRPIETAKQPERMPVLEE